MAENAKIEAMGWEVDATIVAILLGINLIEASFLVSKPTAYRMGSLERPSTSISSNSLDASQPHFVW